MGFNPFREQSNNAVDIGLVVAFLIIITGFVLWALFG